MRVDAVRAIGFGPFVGETLELGPGMNVIYGPNESGKSSWHAAMYAALCGMRRGRGQPTREDRAFANRHRPWRGSAWRVTATITLDDERVIELDQGLGPGGRSVATERATKRALTGDVVRDGSVDAASLLGLTRETVLATVFVRQADVLRVVTDATSLQEYLERAAATNAVDTTADEALARIAEYKRERVGVVRANARGPLATATRQLKEARASLDEAESRFESYQQLLTRRRTAEVELSDAEAELASVRDHEHERLRRERWTEIAALRRRIEQARSLQKQVAAGPQESGPGRDLVERVTRSLAAFEKRPPETATLEGTTAEALEYELAGLPEAPPGDVVPAAEVVEAHDRWRGEVQRLAAHEETEPSISTNYDSAAPIEELRRLADELELSAPDVDASLSEQIERARVAGSQPPALTPVPPDRTTTAASRARVPVIAGGVIAVLGMVVVAVGQPTVGALALLVGALVAGVGVARARREASGRGGVAEPSAPTAVTESALARLEARLEVQEEVRADVERRRAIALDQAAQLHLPTEPPALRQIAAEAEVASTMKARHAEWEQRRNETAAALASATDNLRDTVAAHGTKLRRAENVEEAFARYVSDCKQRDEVARVAGRRADLEAQLIARRAAELAYDHDVNARLRAEQELAAAADAVGCGGGTPQELADSLQAWLRAEEEQDEARKKHGQTSARLDQLLDGRTVAELEEELTATISDAGEPPSDEAPLLTDRSQDLALVDRRARTMRERVAELAGQLEGAEGHLLDVAAAIEAEARADAEVRRIVGLSEDLDYATEILCAAQQKVHADIAPVLNKTLRPWVPRVTDGRYDDIRVNPATLEIEVHEAGGQFRQATQLSHGTTEQLFLLLRLALAEHLGTTGESAPVILDDVTVQSDTERTTAILGLLHDLSTEHQVVLFSQEDEARSWAEGNLSAPADRLIRLGERKRE